MLLKLNCLLVATYRMNREETDVEWTARAPRDVVRMDARQPPAQDNAWIKYNAWALTWDPQLRRDYDLATGARRPKEP